MRRASLPSAAAPRWLGLCIGALAALAGPARRADVLQNELLRAEFDGRGLTAVRDLAAQQAGGGPQGGWGAHTRG